LKVRTKTNHDHGGNVFAVARSLGVPPEAILDFSASINPLGPAKGVREALAASFSSLVHYPDSDSTELRDALAKRHGVESANICIANGSTELIYLLPRLMSGKRALIIAPSFSEYAKALKRDGWRVENFILSSADCFAFHLDLLERELRNGYDLLILANPGNPTGRLYLHSEIEEINRLCSISGCLLVIDEAFMDFSGKESADHLALRNGNILVLRSMTKFYALPGLRLGYAIGSQPIISQLSAIREPWSVNIPAQTAGVASLADADYAAATRELIISEREYLNAELAAIPGLRPFPSSANYLLVETDRSISAGELADKLMKELILIRSCGNFTGLDDQFFRVAVRNRDENIRLIAGIAAAVSDRG
jgi:threonine-phosphate decarboxylase